MSTYRVTRESLLAAMRATMHSGDMPGEMVDSILTHLPTSTVYLRDPLDRLTIRALNALDLTCESVTGKVYDDCTKSGKVVTAQFADDQACWPCRIRAILGSQAVPPAWTPDALRAARDTR